MATNITIEILPSFYMKTDPGIHQEIINNNININAEKLLQNIKEEAPVRTGRLRDSHHITQNGPYNINITNTQYYWKYVVWRGNDYITRGLLQFITSQIITETYHEQLRQNGLI